MGDRSIDALLQQLGSREAGQRDLATKALIRVGKQARAPLRSLLAADSPLRVRAAFTLAGLRPNEQGELLADGGPRTQGRLWGAVAQLVATISAQTGIRIDCGDIDSRKKVALEADATGTLATLDALSLAAAGSWVPTPDGAARLSSTPGARYPTCYAGPFRVRLTSLAALRSTNYRSTRAEATLGLDVTGLTLLSAIGSPLVSDLEAVDDTGARHKLTVTPNWVSETVPQSTPPDLSQLERLADILTRRLIGPTDSFVAKTELPLHALGIQSLRGGFTYLFSESYVDVQLDQLAPGLRVELDEGIVVWVDSVTDDECSLSIKTPDWGHGDGDALDAQPISTVALGIDQEHREALATISRSTSPGVGSKDRGDRRLAVQLSFDKQELGPIQSLRLRLVKEVRAAPVQFEFHGLAFP